MLNSSVQLLPWVQTLLVPISYNDDQTTRCISKITNVTFVKTVEEAVNTVLPNADVVFEEICVK